MKWQLLCLFMFVLLLQCFSQRTTYPQGWKISNEFQGIRIRVLDSSTGLSLPARICIYNDQNELQATYYKHLPGLFTNEDGSITVELPVGKYAFTVFHGIDYLSRKHEFEITGTTGIDAVIYLSPWVPLKDLGWINGEGHAHLYSEKKPDPEMLSGVRKICLAQGVDFICASQGWAGATDDTWRVAYGKVTDKDFLMYYGAEMPKYRTGHFWWLGLESTENFFGQAIDSMYETRYYQSPYATHWDFDSLNFVNIPDLELVPRMAASQNAVAIIAHPTRWWMQEREHSVKYTTNAAANLAFSLLSGNLADGLVIMGDFKDHYSYQNLWFQILNLGYRMPAFSELDGGYLPDFKYPFGLMRTYFQVGKISRDTIQSVVDAVRLGKTFVTTGPVILSNIDGRYGIGDIISPSHTKHIMQIDAFASGDTEDRLSYVLIFRNGKIWKQWDLRKDDTRTFQKKVEILETERAWYVLKAYGKKAWADPENLELMGWYDRTHKAESSDRDVCITSPYYFIPRDRIKPEVLMSDVTLSLSGKHATATGKAEIILYGKKIAEEKILKGRAHFKMPVNAIIKIEVDQAPVVYRSLYIDYEPHLRLMEPLANGDWQKDPRYSQKLFPGYIPWEVFRYEETRKLLSTVQWEISLIQNERDKNREKFAEHFVK